MKNRSVTARNSAVIVAFIVLALAGCDSSARKNEAAQAKAPRVVAAKPTLKTITEWDEYTGRFTAVESVQVRARVSGYLTAIHFTDGQMVKQGNLLFTIDRRPFELAAASADAEVKVAESALEFARQELSRAEALRKSDSVPERLIDERASTVRQEEARLAASRASLDRARLDLEFTEVRSPVSGRIDTHTVSVGNLISGGDTNATLLTNIISLNPIRLTFDVDLNAYLKYVRATQDGLAQACGKAPTPSGSLCRATRDFHGRASLISFPIKSIGAAPRSACAPSSITTIFRWPPACSRRCNLRAALRIKRCWCRTKRSRRIKARGSSSSFRTERLNSATSP
ncbi:multidrug efflux pump subunit AcrA (membrane-fusion protein) [Nitrobacteraceae bacterium AZCC 1564]